MKDTYFLFPIHAGMVVTGLTAEIDGRFLEAKVMERCGEGDPDPAIHHSAQPCWVSPPCWPPRRREAQKSYEKAKETRCPAALAHHGPSEDDTGDLYHGQIEVCWVEGLEERWRS